MLDALLQRFKHDRAEAAARHSTEQRYRDEQREATKRMEMQLAELSQAVKAGANVGTRVGTFLALLVLILVLLLAQTRGLDVGEAAEAAGALVGGAAS